MSFSSEPAGSCRHCAAPLASGERFCGECGQPAVPPAAKTAPAPMQFAEAPPPPPAPVSVGRDTSPGVAVDDPARVAVYARRVAAYAGDGLLEAWERESLEKLRVQLAISDETHERLLSQHRLRAAAAARGPRLALAVDEQAFEEFRVGQRGLIRWVVGNLLRDEAVHGVRILYGLEGKSGLREHAVPTLRPGGRESFHFQQPFDEPGQFLLAAAIEVESDIGDKFHFIAEPLPFRVAAATVGPTTLHMNIDASSARLMQLNADSLGGAARPEAGGGIVEGARWREVRLSAVGEGAFETWVQRMTGPALRSPPPAGRAPLSVPGGEPVVELERDWAREAQSFPWRGPSLAEVPAGTRTLQVQGAGADCEVVVVPKDVVTFGRDIARADVLLAVEPYSPRELYAENLEKTLRMSGVHFQVALGDAEAEFLYVGSHPSTFLGQAPLPARQPMALGQSPREITFGRDGQFRLGALTLRFRTLVDARQRSAALWIERRDNVPGRSYLCLRGAVGFAPAVEGWSYLPPDPPCRLVQVQGRVGLIHTGTEPLQTGAGLLLPGEGVLLTAGTQLQAAGWRVVVA